ncbi:MAG: MarC family protein [Nitrososphaerales archaeon]|nr:MarC family protein [Nitrososphaerales archaeon]
MSLISSFFAFDIVLFAQSVVLLFAILDPIGTVPIFFALTNQTSGQRRQIVRQSVIFAAIILYVFAYVGWLIFQALGITINDFRIAGGVVLFAVAFDHLRGREDGEPRSANVAEIAAFPLATPLLAGPGAISTVIILANPPYGPLLVFLVITLNIVLAYFILSRSEWILKILGDNGSRALTRITALLIAALAVSFIRQGIINIFVPG